jgi:hypothetical protein
MAGVLGMKWSADKKRPPMPPSRQRAYWRWKGMMRRCYNPHDPKHVHYGGRGIVVAAEWHNFERFYADVGDPPEGRTMDRIDNDGHYGPGNFRWATVSEQNFNRRPWVKTKPNAPHSRRRADALTKILDGTSEITINDAAAALNTTPKALKNRLRKRRNRAGVLPSIQLSALQQDRVRFSPNSG